MACLLVFRVVGPAVPLNEVQPPEYLSPQWWQGVADDLNAVLHSTPSCHKCDFMAPKKLEEWYVELFKGERRTLTYDKDGALLRSLDALVRRAKHNAKRGHADTASPVVASPSAVACEATCGAAPKRTASPKPPAGIQPLGTGAGA